MEATGLPNYPQFLVEVEVEFLWTSTKLLNHCSCLASKNIYKNAAPFFLFTLWKIKIRI